MHTKKGLEEPVALKDSLEEWAVAGSHCSAWGSESSHSLPRWIAWRPNVACEMAVAMIPLFKLKIWKTLGKLYPLINYCQAINGI